jgi:hypothetical protein
MIKCMAHLPRDVRSSLRFFAFFVANGTLAVDLLGDIDYRSELVDTGSNLEMVFAVFANVLEVDESGQVTNHDGAALTAMMRTKWSRRSRTGKSNWRCSGPGPVTACAGRRESPVPQALFVCAERVRLPFFFRDLGESVERAREILSAASCGSSRVPVGRSQMICE